METVLHEDSSFDNIDYSEKKFVKSEYIDCRFSNCNFSKADITNSDFMDCQFSGCNFSLAVMENTGLKNAVFTNCKMVGVDFSKCSNFLFAVGFVNCPLDYSSFFQKKMKKTSFIDCSLKDADFTETDLSMASFQNCDLQHATFVRTILEKTDFRTARNYSLDPELNRLKKARFSFPAVAGLLAKYQISIE